MRHLFLAPLATSFGEALHGVRLAQALYRRGEEVIFLATEALSPLTAELPFRVGYIDAALPELDRAVLDLARTARCDSLVLCDLSATAKVFTAYRRNFGWLVRSGLRVAALDCWGLPLSATESSTDGPLVFDYGPSAAEQEALPADIRYCGADQRLYPVPFVSPSVGSGAFRSVSDFQAQPWSSKERTAARAELGLSQRDRLIVFPQAGWQCAAAQRVPRLQAVAAGLPRLLFDGLAAIGSDAITTAHVGPAALSTADLGALAGRYRHLGQLSQQAFAKLLACADLLVGYNLAATSIGTAIARELPVLLTPSFGRGETVEEVRASLALENPLGGKSQPPLASWSEPAASLVRSALPYVPLYAAPLGLSRILTKVLSENPLLSAVRIAELLDRKAIAEAAHALLYETDARASLLLAQRRYLSQVSQLPTADEVLLRIVA